MLLEMILLASYLSSPLASYQYQYRWGDHRASVGSGASVMLRIQKNAFGRWMLIPLSDSGLGVVAYDVADLEGVADVAAAADVVETLNCDYYCCGNAVDFDSVVDSDDLRAVSSTFEEFVDD
jgi:hypothetical protein